VAAYGRGLAADIVSVSSSAGSDGSPAEKLWKWIDAVAAKECWHRRRPYLDRDPPMWRPIDGKEYVSSPRGGENARGRTAIGRMEEQPGRRQRDRPAARRSRRKNSRKAGWQAKPSEPHRPKIATGQRLLPQKLGKGWAKKAEPMVVLGRAGSCPAHSGKAANSPRLRLPCAPAVIRPCSRPRRSKRQPYS